jgi:hypothetical protein
MMVDFDEGQHVRIVNPLTGGLVCDDAVIVPRPFYASDCEIWVLQHHDTLGMFPASWIVAA